MYVTFRFEEFKMMEICVTYKKYVFAHLCTSQMSHVAPRTLSSVDLSVA